MSYTPTNWQTGDTVTAALLNKMESGIELANDAFVVALTPTAQDYSGTMDKTPEEIDLAIRANKKILFHILGMGAIVEATQFINEYAITEEGLWKAAANITFNINGTPVLISVATSFSSQTYLTGIFPLTPMS